MSAADPGKAVALLARAGDARDRLRQALDQAGARVVLEEDPGMLDAATLAAAQPQAVLVALEPTVEDALVVLEPALEAPGLLVIFDEAELAARRDGWEAQRWVRHLAAKLHGHADVLPPGCEQEDVVDLQPGRPITPQQLHALDPFEAHLQEAAARADDLPQDRPGEAPEQAPAVAELQAEATLATTLPAAHEWALAEDAQPAARTAVAQQAPPAATSFANLELVALEEERPALVGVVLVLAGVGGAGGGCAGLAAGPDRLAWLAGAAGEVRQSGRLAGGCGRAWQPRDRAQGAGR